MIIQCTSLCDQSISLPVTNPNVLQYSTRQYTRFFCATLTFVRRSLCSHIIHIYVIQTYVLSTGLRMYITYMSMCRDYMRRSVCSELARCLGYVPCCFHSQTNFLVEEHIKCNEQISIRWAVTLNHCILIQYYQYHQHHQQSLSKHMIAHHHCKNVFKNQSNFKLYFV